MLAIECHAWYFLKIMLNKALNSYTLYFMCVAAYLIFVVRPCPPIPMTMCVVAPSVQTSW